MVLNTPLHFLPVSKFVALSEMLKVGLSPSKKVCCIRLNESPLKVMKNAVYFIIKALFVLKVFEFLS